MPIQAGSHEVEEDRFNFGLARHSRDFKPTGDREFSSVEHGLSSVSRLFNVMILFQSVCPRGFYL